MENVVLSFPGLGIDEFTLNKIAFSLGDSIKVRWYAILIVCGIIAAYVYSCLRAKTNGLTSDDMTDVALSTIICGVVGARVYYVLSKLDSYTNFWDVFKIWNGGIAIYGALIGGGLALFITCKIKKISWRAVFDTVAPGVLLAQGIGRWGNFVNGEAYGVAPAEDSFLWIFRMTVRQENWGTSTLASPCFLYESLWCILGFVLINIFYKKLKKYDGQIFFEYAAWYSFGRMFIEGLRTDSLYLFGNENLPRKSQVLALVIVVASIICMILFGLLARRKKKEQKYLEGESAYDSVLAAMRADETESADEAVAAENAEDADEAVAAENAEDADEADAENGAAEEAAAASEDETQTAEESTQKAEGEAKPEENEAEVIKDERDNKEDSGEEKAEAKQDVSTNN